MSTIDTRVFAAARDVLDYLLVGIDSHASGLIVGAHITGSIALGDERPGQSDIDVVLVRDTAADNSSTMAALEPALDDLRRTHPQPMVDGLVLDMHDLENGPDHMEVERPIIFANAPWLGPDGSGRNPVTWQTLRQCGVAFRGLPLDHGSLWHDPARLDTWTRQNLESYWRPWLVRGERLAAHPELESLIDEATEWGVLGVTRLHYTLATGRVTSKHGAGEYALNAFEKRWHPIVEEAIRIREARTSPSPIPAPQARIREIHAYMTMVIDTALELPPHDASSGLNRP